MLAIILIGVIAFGVILVYMLLPGLISGSVAITATLVVLGVGWILQRLN